MISRLNHIVPALLCVASMVFAAGCNGEADTSAEARAASASDSAQAENNNIGRATRSDERSERDRSRERLERDSGARSERTRTARADARDRSAAMVIQAEPTSLDLGELATREQRSGTVTLRNVGDRPMMIEGSRTDCGCTVANVPEGRYLEPGESVDVEVTLRGGAREQTLRKNVTFMFNEQPNIRVQVIGHVKSYVTVDPERIYPAEIPDGRVVIRSEDGQPFRVLSVNPDVGEIPSDEPATEHEVFINWEAWEEQRQARQLRFLLDHPKTNQTVAHVHVPRQHREDLRADRDPHRDRQRERDPRAEIQHAVQENDVERLETLIVERGVDVDTTDGAGLTLLGNAARHGKIEMVNMLLKHGADVNAADRVGRTPLMAAGQAGKTEAVRILLNAGADVSARDNTLGGTALAWTAGFGDAESIALLLDAGSEVDAVGGTTGYTPLIWAAGFGEDESVRLLIEAGADVEAVDFTQGMTPSIHAARRGSVAAIKLLADAGADIERADATGRNPLLWAAGSNDATVEVIDALIELGVDIEATDRHGQNALDHARGRTDEHAPAVVKRLEELLGGGHANEDEDDAES